jgi:hypothetical protein
MAWILYKPGAQLGTHKVLMEAENGLILALVVSSWFNPPLASRRNSS